MLNANEQKMVINIAGAPVTFEIAREPGKAPFRATLKPGEQTALPVGYASALSSMPGRDPRPSIIDTLTGGKVLPVDDPNPKHKDAIASALKLGEGGGKK